MTQLTLNITDESIIPSLTDIIGRIKGVKIKPFIPAIEKHEQQAVMTDDEVLEGLQTSFKEMQAIEKDLLRPITVDELLHEL